MHNLFLSTKNAVVKTVAILKTQYVEYLLERKIVYRLLKIDLQKQTVLLQVRGKNITINKTLAQIVNETDVVDGISSEQACWLGINYGKMIRAATEGRKILKKIKRLSSPLNKKTHGQYKILYENRNGNIGYMDTIYQNTYVESPLAIIQNEYVINKFNPNQAFYIGFLAGMMLEKVANREKSRDSTDNLDKLFRKYNTHLRVVK